MNENAKKWIEDLRSGEFEQGHGYLTRNGEDCCLGVACKRYQKEVGDLVVTTEEIRPGAMVMYYDDERSVLPEKVQLWLGLQSNEGNHKLEADQGTNCLSGMNDSGSSFAEIASVGESEPEGLFFP